MKVVSVFNHRPNITPKGISYKIVMYTQDMVLVRGGTLFVIQNLKEWEL